ncbi:50S ribosomal protein L25 [bacterium]|nr:50S ribosomal protein L25 [bacterium]MBU1653110.1 50S ribosomal protein L25 [bacterium]
MEQITLNALVREESGKGNATRLRQQGLLPGVFYLGTDLNKPIKLSALELKRILRQKPSIIRLKLDDGTDYECVIREIQRDPVTGDHVHIDLMGIVRGKKMTVQVPVELVGSSIGVRTEGGVLQQNIHKLNIECLPKDIPDKVTINISDLEIGDSIHVRDLKVENVKLLDELQITIVTVLAPRIDKTLEPAEEEGEEGEGEEGGEEASEETEE